MQLISKNINIILIVFLFIISSNQNAFGQNMTDIEGKWRSEDGKLKLMTIYKNANNFYYGKDENGELVLSKLEIDKSNHSFKGKMSPPDANIQLDATITIIDKNKLKVVASKYIMSKTMYLIRIND
jgi:hypothetical protein